MCYLSFSLFLSGTVLLFGISLFFNDLDVFEKYMTIILFWPYSRMKLYFIENIYGGIFIRIDTLRSLSFFFFVKSVQCLVLISGFHFKSFLLFPLETPKSCTKSKNSTPVPSKQSARWQVAKELYQTESNYVNILTTIIQVRIWKNDLCFTIHK